jgi:hypothetical protein
MRLFVTVFAVATALSSVSTRVVSTKEGGVRLSDGKIAVSPSSQIAEEIAAFNDVSAALKALNHEDHRLAVGAARTYLKRALANLRLIYKRDIQFVQRDPERARGQIQDEPAVADSGAIRGGRTEGENAHKGGVFDEVGADKEAAAGAAGEDEEEVRDKKEEEEEKDEKDEEDLLVAFANDENDLDGVDEDEGEETAPVDADAEHEEEEDGEDEEDSQ